MLKQERLAIPLTYMINLSLTTGIFPEKLKLAKTIPIYKSGARDDMSNYRPISILSCISKVYERIVYDQTVSFLNKYKILNETQYGFRGHSTNHALVQTIEKITTAIDNQLFVLGVFLDLSKAFDSIDHKVLLQKLPYYGIRGLVHKWFCSYLSKREQSVTIDNTQSDKKLVKYGVPQGSIMGPLLFLLFVNDMPSVCTKTQLISFADDTNIFLKHNNINEAFDIMNEELKRLYMWFKANKLTINTNKTKLMVFSGRNTVINTAHVELVIDQDIIQRVDKIKFLGVILDEKINCSQHANAILP